ncbi:hypothetical protein JTE90_014057 [Oedothorax gibbosus]|uniref:SPIN-DOC-like zinc-finger domain-containing protein n=1 Tax=Oedothorax gibbosus TaxID=931172 RepID=A0AAV6V3Z4_9ARAC|nr:hypothetical protein JTE90_014057 [Oedothorax gibbosus]
MKGKQTGNKSVLGEGRDPKRDIYPLTPETSPIRSTVYCKTLILLGDLSDSPPSSKFSRLGSDKDSRSSRMLMTFVEEVQKRKKPKNYRFHYEWESEFLFTMANGKCTCLICHATVAISKKSNLRRHFSTMHKHFNSQYPENSSARAMRVVELKSAFPSSSLLDECVTMGLSPTKSPTPTETTKYFDFFPSPEVRIL